MRVVFALLVVLGACIDDPTKLCGAQRCSADLVCTPGGCATVEAATACVDAVETEECVVGVVRGVCLGGACQPTVCGDGRFDRSEMCEDGNTLAGDGCSAACDSTEVCGNSVIDLIVGEQCDSGPPGLSSDGCSSGCKLEFASWRDVSPKPIAARAGAGAAFNFNGVILFGGATTTGLLDDTWVRNNDAWTRLYPAGSPSPRTEPAMAYDPVNQQVILFGGLGTTGALGDTWSWNGTTWTQLAPLASPPARRGASLVYDEDLQRVVLLGGADEGVWEFDGVTWTPATTSPGGKAPGVAAWDGVSGAILYFVAGETWARDAGVWAKRTTTRTPQARGFAAMAFDSAHSQVVLFGGLDDTGNYLDASWVWNGNDWSAPQVTVAPSARSLATLVYDSNGLMLFGGFYQGPNAQVFADIHDWDGTEWALVTDDDSLSPGRRSYSAVAEDRRGNRLRLYGGAPRLGGDWAWFNNAWLLSQQRIAHPRGSEGARMTYAPDGEMVFFGGIDIDGVTLAETWLDGPSGGWHEVPVVTRPAPRAFHAMASDGAQVIMFGGRNGPEVHGDTLAWTGDAWQTLTPSMTPSPRAHMLMVRDEARGRVVLYGGMNFTTVFGDTWEWDGTTWHSIPTTTSPGPRADYAMAYDPARQRVVLFGGSNATGSRYDDTWEWDGTHWVEIAFAIRPPVRVGAMLAYEAARRRLILFGGFGFAEALEDTWALEYSAPGEAVERCLLATEDLDGDGAAGCDDIDCWGRCTPLCPPLSTCGPDKPQCGDNRCELGEEDYLLCPQDCMF